MRNNRYIDYKLIENFPNKYNLKPSDIKKLKIIDWTKLKKHTWFNKAMNNGSWWCHLEGCDSGCKYEDMDEFWIGFREEDNKIDYHFTCFDGMCSYNIDNFYDINEIENKWDMNVQVNAIKYLNSLLDDGILSIA